MAETVPTSKPIPGVHDVGDDTPPEVPVLRRTVGDVDTGSVVIHSVSVIAPSRDLVDALKIMPVILKYHYISPVKDGFVERALKTRPSVVVVCSDGHSVISGRRICDAVKGSSNTPVVFVNNGELPSNFSHDPFADVDVLYPTNFEERFNLVVELARIAYNVPVPSVRVGPSPAEVKLVKHRSRTWTLVGIPFTSIVSGAIALWLTNDPELAAQFALIMVFVITGTVVSPSLIEKIIEKLVGKR
jgi:hypothetical protein